MKHGFPIQTAEYTVSRGLQGLPAFSWRVNHTLRKRYQIAKAVVTRYLKKTHKFGLRLPKMVKEAYKTDQETRTDFWHKAIIIREMKNKIVDDDTIPIGYQWIPYHMIFDVKLDLTCKDRFVAAGGHWTDPDPILRDSSVVTFLIAALNELDVKLIDIGNA